MSTRSRQLEMGMYGVEDIVETPSRCSRFLYYSWKLTTCIFSHTLLISLVVSYCILGAFTFESLEAANEIKVKQSIRNMRNNVTEKIWRMTNEASYLHAENWTINVTEILCKFETDILKAIKKDGWDGIEETGTVQWTFAGALFYSIIVITTIGYGHIAPKTHWGKVVTIFYAILGIPLMLLCLSNIGDIMATSFRFLYWRVCCYVCTKKPKRQTRRTIRSARGSVRVPSSRYSSKSRAGTLRRSARISQRSGDSGLGCSENRSSYSDTECRYNSADKDPNLQRILRRSQMSRFSDSAVSPSRRAAAMAAAQAPVPPSRAMASPGPTARGGSLDRRRRNVTSTDVVVDPASVARTPVLCNKYAVDHVEKRSTRKQQDDNLTDDEEEDIRPQSSRRAQSLPRTQPDYLEPPTPADVDLELTASLKRKEKRRSLGVPQSSTRRHHPSPRIMSPMGFAVSRQYYDDFYDDDEYFEDMYYPSANGERRIKPVPIWLCVFLVVSYILGGAFLFTRWENWDFLDSAYFCFITLTTIGFGDFVPAKHVKQNAEVSIALCSLYLLFGIALLAMSFNLVQEEVIANVKSVARRLGIIKDDRDDYDDED